PVADGAEARQLLQRVHEPGDRAHGVRVVVEQPPAPRAEPEEHPFREVGDGVGVADRVEDGEDLVGVYLAGAALPHPHDLLDRMQCVPGQLAPTVLEAPPLEHPLHERDRDDDPDDLRAEIREEVTRRALGHHEERQPDDPGRDQEEAAGDEDPQHGPSGMPIVSAGLVVSPASSVAALAPASTAGPPTGRSWTNRVTRMARSLQPMASASRPGGRWNVPGPNRSAGRRWCSEMTSSMGDVDADSTSNTTGEAGSP